MKRKIVQQGPTTLMVSLPSKWVKRKGLKKGDEIDLLEVPTGLFIGSAARRKPEISFDMTEESSKGITALLTHMYRMGYDKIILRGVDDRRYKEIKSLVSDLLLGFDVTSRQKSVCTIENISEPTDDKYDTLMRRIFLLIKETGAVTLDSARAAGFTRFSEIEDLRRNVDKFILFCRRVLIKEKHIGNPLLHWELLTFLMHVQHGYFYLYKYASENKVKPRKEVVFLLEGMQGYFDDFYAAFFSKDITAVYRIAAQKGKYQFGACIDALEKSRGKDTVILSYIRELFRRVQVGTSPILAMILEEKYKEPT